MLISTKSLQNASSPAIVTVHTAENDPPEVLQNENKHYSKARRAAQRAVRARGLSCLRLLRDEEHMHLGVVFANFCQFFRQKTRDNPIEEQSSETQLRLVSPAGTAPATGRKVRVCSPREEL